MDKTLPFSFSELPYGKYKMYLCDNKTYKCDLTYLSKANIKIQHHDMPRIGEIFFMKNYLDSFVCVFDGEVIWADSLVRFIVMGASHGDWLTTISKIECKFKDMIDNQDGVRLLLAMENL